MRFIKKTIKFLLNKLGYEVLSSTYIHKVIPSMASPCLDQNHIKNCKLLASRELLVDLLPKGGVLAEVGVASGYFTRVLLEKMKPSEFYALDLFDYPLSTSNDLSHFDYYSNKFSKEIDDGKLMMRRGYSWEELAKFPDDYFDFIYLDADHSYDAVVKDLNVIKKKIKKNGVIQFNDYTTFNPLALMAFGVQRAVNEFIIKENYEMIYYSLDRNNFCDVVLKKMS